jgi:hypothetical protein
MITFKSYYLIESVSPDTKGKIHEILVAKHLNGGKHISPEAAKHFKTLTSGMHPNEVKDFHNRALHTAEHIKKHVASLGHEIHSVHHTSKAGDIGRLTGTHESQQENSADIMIKTKSGHHIGYSLKVSDKKNQKVPIGNPGHGQTDKQLGVNTQTHYEHARKALEKAHPELQGRPKSEQKKLIKANPHMRATAEKLGNAAITKIRDTWHKKLDSMDKKDLSDHIRNNLLHAHKTKTPLYKSSAGGTGGDYSHHLTHPESQYNHLLNDHKNLHVEKSGNNSINFVHVHPKTGVKTLVVKHRIKPESTPVVTSLKGSAEGVH